MEARVEEELDGLHNVGTGKVGRCVDFVQAMRNLCLPTEDLIKANYFLSNPTKETYWQAVSETRFSRWQGVPSLVYYFEITVGFSFYYLVLLTAKGCIDGKMRKE